LGLDGWPSVDLIRCQSSAALPKSVPEGRRGYRFSGIDALVLQGGSSGWTKLDCMG